MDDLAPLDRCLNLTSSMSSLTKDNKKIANGATVAQQAPIAATLSIPQLNISSFRLMEDIQEIREDDDLENANDDDSFRAPKRLLSNQKVHEQRATQENDRFLDDSLGIKLEFSRILQTNKDQVGGQALLVEDKQDVDLTEMLKNLQQQRQLNVSTEAVLNESLSGTANQSLGSLMLSARRRPMPEVNHGVEESLHGSAVKSSE